MSSRRIAGAFRVRSSVRGALAQGSCVPRAPEDDEPTVESGTTLKGATNEVRRITSKDLFLATAQVQARHPIARSLRVSVPSTTVMRNVGICPRAVDWHHECYCSGQADLGIVGLEAAERQEVLGRCLNFCDGFRGAKTRILQLPAEVLRAPVVALSLHHRVVPTAGEEYLTIGEQPAESRNSSPGWASGRSRHRCSCNWARCAVC